MRAKANEARGLHDEGIVSRMGPNTMVQLWWWCFLWGSGLLERIGCPRALASPGARVGLAPLPDAVDLGRAAEGSTVVGGGPPTALAGRVARLAARGRGAGAWPPRAARVGSKAGLTVLALACGEWTSHGPVSPQAHARKIVAWKEANREEKTGRRRSKQTEEGDKYHRWMGRRRTGLNDHFNRTVSSQFLIAADTTNSGRPDAPRRMLGTGNFVGSHAGNSCAILAVCHGSRQTSDTL